MDELEAHRLAELERLAEACLSAERPTPALAHELAAHALSLIGRRRTGASPVGPYRASSSAGPEGQATLAALERCEAECDALRREVASLRAR